jgi:uncharacterized membrane protein
MATLLLLLAFILLTPNGWLNKIDAIGYAVCHRASTHSVFVQGRQLPLCARCTGTFVGALAGFFGQRVILRRRRAGRFPPVAVLILLVLFMVLWAVDGLNSYLSVFPGDLNLYRPRNWLRLVTGTLNGLAVAALLYPVLGFTLWQDYTRERGIRHIGELLLLVVVGAVPVGLVLWGWDPLLLPIAISSGAGVLFLLTCVNTLLVVMILRWENNATTWRQALAPIMSGLALSLVQVGLIDLLRYWATGTWAGFTLP